MNIQTKFHCIIPRMLTKITVIVLMALLGVTVTINTLAVDYGIKLDMAIQHSKQCRASSIGSMNYTIRRVTAYNVGDPFQTDRDPCIGANRKNLCHALAHGEKICAANFVPLNTYLYIQNYGVCRVTDRMNRRFKNRVDIAMAPQQKDAAVKFGVQALAVSVLD